MNIRKSQTGFSAVEMLVTLVVIAVLALVGYTVYSRGKTNNTATSNNSQQSNEESAIASDVKSAPDINSAEDLDKAAAVLDETDPSGSNNNDSIRLESHSANF